jgi:hypothetical protein
VLVAQALTPPGILQVHMAKGVPRTLASHSQVSPTHVACQKVEPVLSQATNAHSFGPPELALVEHDGSCEPEGGMHAIAPPAPVAPTTLGPPPPTPMPVVA